MLAKNHWSSWHIVIITGWPCDLCDAHSKRLTHKLFACPLSSHFHWRSYSNEASAIVQVSKMVHYVCTLLVLAGNAAICACVHLPEISSVICSFTDQNRSVFNSLGVRSRQGTSIRGHWHLVWHKWMTSGGVAKALPQAIRLVGWPKLVTFFFFFRVNELLFRN